MIIIHSAERRGFYTENKSFEHDFFFEKLQDPGLKINLFEKAAVKSSGDLNFEIFTHRGNPLQRALASRFHQILKTFSIHPTSFRYFLKWRKKGSLIAHLKTIAEQPKED